MKITTNYNSNQKYQQHFGILIPAKGKALEIINARIGTDIELSDNWTESFLRFAKEQMNNKTVNMRIVKNKDDDSLFVGVYKGDNRTLLKDFQEKDVPGQERSIEKLMRKLKQASDYATDQIKILENAKKVKNPQEYIGNAASL